MRDNKVCSQLEYGRGDESGAIEWEEFEVGGAAPSSSEHTPRKESQDSTKDSNYQDKLHTKNNNSGSGDDVHNTSSRSRNEVESIERAFDAPIRNISRSSISSSRHAFKSKMNGSADVTSPAKTGKEAATSRRRRDSWDNPVDDRPSQHNGHGMDAWDSPMDEERGGGIGKLKISREMKEKLEALTSSPAARLE